MSPIRITELAYDDEELARFELPGGELRITRGIGSGLARRPGDPPGTIWAITDRGPNLKVAVAIERYGIATLARHAETPGAKVMPCPGVGPAIVRIHVDGDRVSGEQAIPLRDASGAALSGLPPADAGSRAAEPAIDLAGTILPPSPGGADTEGLAIAADGSGWAGDEYGPSLLRLDAAGVVVARWVPAGTEALFAGAPYPVQGVLPALAARRRLNRGFEGLALSADGRRLHVAMQSPLAHPDDAAGRRARHVRLWTLDAQSGALLAEHLYALDKPRSFARDCAAGDVDRADLKLCDVAALPSGDLLILERASATAKLYRVRLDPADALDPVWNDPARRPTLEEASADGTLDLPAVAKHLLFSTDDHPEIGPDLEGVALLGERSLLLVNDNDFGVEGVATRFWRVELAEAIDRP
ncbi:MAG TPA: esterase-like activity of phytase family protein [Sphingomonas sp.]|nr:esterase-like activity of phytase family protein [Sphingomonas sp.]